MIKKESHCVYIGLGSNKGQREFHLAKSIEKISCMGNITGRSSLYVSEPWMVDNNHGDYLNMVLRVETDLNPIDLLKRLTEIEIELGRNEKGLKKPREIDIDILLYGDLVIDSNSLTIPHDQMHLRPFVMVPMTEIAPRLKHPQIGLSMMDLSKKLPYSRLKKLNANL